jgi:hypothetical protein
VQDGTVFREVDLLPSEHGVDPCSQAAFLCQLPEEREGVVGDAIFRVIEVEAYSLCRHALATRGVICEEISQV